MVVFLGCYHLPPNSEIGTYPENELQILFAFNLYKCEIHEFITIYVSNVRVQQKKKLKFRIITSIKHMHSIS